MKDYLAMRKKSKGDKLDYGIKGMKWGVRRSSAQLAADTKKRAAKGEPVTPTQKAKAVIGGESTSASRPAGSETSSQRYARLKAQAKAGQQNNWDDADLKFFNARTEALAKIAKLNEQKPGWLSETTKSVVQNSARRQMQMLADALADKYINEKLVESLAKSTKKT